MHLKAPLFLLSMILPSIAIAYHVVVTDQNSQTVRVFDRNAENWNKDAIFWSWSAEGGPWPWSDRNWRNVDEVKIRKTADHGWVALITTSAGKVGMIDINSDRDTNIDNVIWEATPTGDDGNPHSIERIPYVGAIVVASSHANELTVYAPENPDHLNDLGSIKKVGTYEVDFAHGVLWDPKTGDDGALWALGRNVLVRFQVVGKGLSLELKKVKTYKLPSVEGDNYDGNLNGHDLQPSYRDDDILLLTHTRGAFAFSKSTGEFKEIMHLTKLKSFVETEDGEYIWVQGGEGDMGQYVSFSDRSDPTKVTDKRGWQDARFYKARIYNPDYY
ncbi:hypothetical protein BDV11DRAFT_199503 [Aspergillus similis]